RTAAGDDGRASRRARPGADLRRARGLEPAGRRMGAADEVAAGAGAGRGAGRVVDCDGTAVHAERRRILTTSACGHTAPRTGNPRRGVSVSSRRGWGPGASEKM